ncbi:hypothetical protein E2562_003016, partial [Oryza meyeriana var. granulata]
LPSRVPIDADAAHDLAPEALGHASERGAPRWRQATPAARSPGPQIRYTLVGAMTWGMQAHGVTY